jgi:hypothetical protein
MRGLLRLPLAYLLTRFMLPKPMGWMPGLWADLEALKPDLSKPFWQATARHRQEFVALGFSELGFKKAKRILDPLHRDNGGVNYLDRTRTHFGQLLYNKRHVAPPVDADREHLTIAFTAAFGEGLLSYTTSKRSLESLPLHEVVRLPSADVKTLYQGFLKHLKRSAEPPRVFPDVGSLRDWFDANQLEKFEDKVRRRVYLLMTGAEVEAAARKIPPPLPKGPVVA